MLGALLPLNRFTSWPLRRGALRFSAVVCFPAWALFQASVCRADSDAKNECAAAYEQAQVAKAEGDLLGASERLLFCGGASCPSVMHADCNRWLDEVRDSMPTVAFRPVSSNGTEIEGATVSVDGQAEILLQGRAIAVNPGDHEIVVAAPGYAPLRRQFKFIEGQKLRQELITLTSTATDVASSSSVATPETGVAAVPFAPRDPGGTPTLVLWIAGGVSVAGGVGFAYWGLTARSGEAALADCSPRCSERSVDVVKANYLRANVSLGCGVAALAVAAIHYFGTRTPTAAARVSSVRIGVDSRFIRLEGMF